MKAAPRIEAPARALVVAVAMAGVTAAYMVSPVMWLATPMVLWVILRAAVREGQLPGTPDVDIRELPAPLRERVRSAFAELPAGDARRLLLAVVNQARLVFSRDESRFDAGEERQLREHVTGLVDACCSTAFDLSRLDQFTAPATEGATTRADLVARASKARELFHDRLTDAAAALAELYTSNVERGTPSTDRVAELTAEISSDASARTAATAEMAKLLGEL
jgi:hypothetical protein